MYNDLREHKKHGDTQFPVAVYPVSHHRKQPILYHHWHNEYEWVYMDTGEGIFTINGEEFYLKEKDAILVGSSQVHSGIALTEHSRFLSVVFHPNFIFNVSGIPIHDINLAPDHIQFQQKYSSDHPEDTKILDILQTIMKELLEHPIAYQLSVKSLLLSVFTKLLREHRYVDHSGDESLSNREKKNYMLKKIINYIYDNYNSHISIQDISTYMGITPQYLCNFFKDMTDTSIVHFINQYRIDSACTKLKNHDLSITDAAISCGFDNISYFNRVFRSHMGCTPTEYRKKNV